MCSHAANMFTHLDQICHHQALVSLWGTYCQSLLAHYLKQGTYYSGPVAQGRLNFRSGHHILTETKHGIRSTLMY